MAHKTLIDGTSYNIVGGTTLVDGVGYRITAGKTLIDGTAYDIKFASEPNYIYTFQHPATTAISSGTYRYGIRLSDLALTNMVDPVEQIDYLAWATSTSSPIGFIFNKAYALDNSSGDLLPLLHFYSGSSSNPYRYNGTQTVGLGTYSLSKQALENGYLLAYYSGSPVGVFGYYLSINYHYAEEE